VRRVPASFYGSKKSLNSPPPDFALAELPPGADFDFARQRARIWSML